MTFNSGSGFATLILSTSADPLHLKFQGDKSNVTRSIVFDNAAGVGNQDNYLIRSISKAEKILNGIRHQVSLIYKSPVM